jgi:hypothetical protein
MLLIGTPFVTWLGWVNINKVSEVLDKPSGRAAETPTNTNVESKVLFLERRGKLGRQIENSAGMEIYFCFCYLKTKVDSHRAIRTQDRERIFHGKNRISTRDNPGMWINLLAQQVRAVTYKGGSVIE